MTPSHHGGVVVLEDFMVDLLLIAAALQLRTATPAIPTVVRPPAEALARLAADSLRDARRAHDAQARFERARRAELPWEDRGAGRCDVRVGRFCWWYDETTPALPPEAESIRRRRRELIAEMDAVAQRIPGDEWVAGMRVHYRVEAGLADGADSVARECRAADWWCSALLGYAAQARGDPARADSAFAAALSAMTEEQRCAWTNITTLLPGGARGRYEALPCAERAPLERRYWMLGRPRLGAGANEWRNEFYARRVQGRLAARSLTPEPSGWGWDAEELLLRYGWPVAWARVRGAMQLGAEYGVVGHDPSPSYAFGPLERLLDSLASAGSDGWEPRDQRSPTRFAPAHLRRLLPATVQLARFRRGDSTLLVAAFAAADDSLRAPRALLAASADDGLVLVSAVDSVRAGQATLVTPWTPRLAGVEVSDSAMATLARSRTLFPAEPGPSVLSDLLVYRPAAEPAATLESALALAVRGDTVDRARPVGLYWERYAAPGTDSSFEMSVTVERIDRSWLRGARQRLRMEDPDSPIRLRWVEGGRPVAATLSHSVSLALNDLPAGRYRVTLAMTPLGGKPARTSREIQLLER